MSIFIVLYLEFIVFSFFRRHISPFRRLLFVSLFPIYIHLSHNQTEQKQMKTFKVEFQSDENFNSENIISSVTFQCKSIATAFKMIYNFFPKEFVAYKIYDNGKCRGFSNKENYLKFYNIK